MTAASAPSVEHSGLYTPDQRMRRDNSVWTLVQGVLAPLQFIVFLVSLGLVVRYMITGEGYVIATTSIILKTAVLYLIMITGAIWEKVVFGQWLFTPAFFWEDVISFGVIALHSLYLYGLFTELMPPQTLIIVVLAAYSAYLINAVQFLWKLRCARLQSAGIP
ncbi:2-vinyl bacteriochlorophyllide hydratase [Pseudopelagicola sp. nBUS_19]|uniref:2-vinyl bacteriochlorophyllide hydratase n=1 Tax=unclassified Pseudopelagicola TaxID=2649563 RepID=UPI003EBA87C6